MMDELFVTKLFKAMILIDPIAQQQYSRRYLARKHG